MQSKLQSLLETFCNTASGMALSWLAGLIVFPAFGVTVSKGENFSIVCIYTAISIARSFLWRRIFNRLHH